MNRSRLLALVLALAAANAGAQLSPLGTTSRRIVSCSAEASMADCRAMAQKAGYTVLRSLNLIHAVVVETSDEEVSAASNKLAFMPHFARIDADKKVKWVSSVDAQEFAAPAGLADVARQMRTLAATPQADPRVPWGVARVGAPQEWTATQGDGATVGVIDTGIDATHPDLQGQVVGGVNILDAAHPDSWADDEGHGTHVSGTIAGKGAGLFGVAPKAKLYAIKVLDKDGNGDYSSVIAGIQWAMDHGIKIVNMSLSADEGSDPLHRAIQAAVAAGVTIIASSGNNGPAVAFPGAYPEVITVGASDSFDHLAAFSNQGPQVSFIAPGVNVLSAKMGGGYVTMSGTSMASPHIAGLAALAWSLGAHDPKSLRAALTRAARPLSGMTATQEGTGMVVAGNFGPTPSAPLTASNGQFAMASLVTVQ
jgi:subtilisin family serine protease